MWGRQDREKKRLTVDLFYSASRVGLFAGNGGNAFE